MVFNLIGLGSQTGFIECKLYLLWCFKVVRKKLTDIGFYRLKSGWFFRIWINFLGHDNYRNESVSLWTVFRILFSKLGLMFINQLLIQK
jgi:hypothetical protein